MARADAAQERKIEKLPCAEQFQLVDKKGNIRMILGVDSAGAATLSVWDGSGKPRVFVGVTKDDHPLIAFLDTSGGPRIGIELDKDGNVGFGAFGEGRRGMAGIVVTGDNAPGIELRDKAGNVVWKAP